MLCMLCSSMCALSRSSAVLEFVCDLMYNVTMSLIHTSVQGAVFQAVLKQDIAFFDASPTGKHDPHESSLNEYVYKKSVKWGPQPVFFF